MPNGTIHFDVPPPNDDLTNVSIALDARRLNPKATVVLRLFDQQLGAHLEKGAGINRALSTSALAAPAFVGAALGDTTRGSFETGDGSCLIEDWAVGEASPEIGRPLREWSASSGWSVIGLSRGSSWQVEQLDSVVLQAGDRLTVFRWKMNLPFVDALYFVVTIITTAGFGDYNFQNASPYLKLYGAMLMLCGAAILATLFSIITDLVLSTRFRDVLARGCSRLQDHIIVIGLGNLGFRVLRELARSGETVVAVERDAGGKFVETARSLAPVVLGNGRAEETLQKAGLAGAKAVLALTDDDIVNLSIGLAAKRARPGVWSVLRVYDASLADKLRASLGMDAVLSVSAEAAATFVSAALGPDVLHGFLLGDFLVVVFKRTATSGTVQIPAARNELAMPAGGVGARWYRLRQET